MRQRSRMIDCLNVSQGSVKAQLAESKKHTESINGEIIIQHSHAKSGLGKAIRIQLYSLSNIDSSTGERKLSQEVHPNHGKRIHKLNGNKCVTYELTFEVARDFGFPGAFFIWNQHKGKFFLQSLSLQVAFGQMIHFECNSWIYPNHLTQKARIFFSNTVSKAFLVTCSIFQQQICSVFDHLMMFSVTFQAKHQMVCCN